MEEGKAQKRKYVLFKKEGSDSGPKQCAFFASQDGCRNGSSCLFLHVKDGVTHQTKATEKLQIESSKQAQLQKESAAHTVEPPTSNKKAKVIAGSSATEVQRTLTTQSPSDLNIYGDDDDEDSSLLFGAVDVALNGYTPVAASLNSRRGDKKKRESTGSGRKTQIVEILDHSSTHHILSTSGTPHATLGNARPSKNLANNFEKVASAGREKVTIPIKQTNSESQPSSLLQSLPLAPAMPAPRMATAVAGMSVMNGSGRVAVMNKPDENLLQEALSLVSSSVLPKPAPSRRMTLHDIIHPGAVDWIPLVEMTRQSLKYEKDYTFATDDLTWCRSTIPNSDAHPVLAIDCEMCATMDPVTNTRNSMHLIRFSLISPTEVLIDTLVNPEAPVVDMRTSIHGISEDDLKNVKFTIRHAQAIMKAYCGEGTVIVGHALYNDLRTLKFAHNVVVDTSYLYTIENEPGQSPSIRDISEAVFGKSMDNIHDSVMDAKASLEAAQQILKNGLHPAIPRSATSAARQHSSGLLVHRIPHGCDVTMLTEMMVKLCAIIPTLVQPIQWTKDNSGVENGKTMVYFLSKEHADLAFDALPGPNRPDKSNRPQKRAYLKGGGYMCIRKNLIV